MEKQRSNFTGKIGFILAAAGSAVGLGNLWRFPYLAAKYGGGIFLLVYILLGLTFGLSLMVAEIAIGRKTGYSAIGAFRALDKRFSFVGYLVSIVPVLILPYYSVIGGWVTKYLTVYVTGGGHDAAADSYFGGFISGTVEPLVWFAIFMAATAIVVFFGVEKGIEKVSKIMMPVLVVLSIFVAIYSICMPGALEGVVYYLKPDFSHFTFMTVVAALGQLFYSMSLAMGIMITFGSYMKKDVSVESSAYQIQFFDTGIAFLAGLMIIPAVFTFYGSDPALLEQNLKAGPSLMFAMLPKVFGAMPGGQVIGAVFFLLVLLAALTSSISLMETVVSILQDRLNWNRKLSCLVVFVFSLLLGVPSSLGFGVWGNVQILGMSFLDFFDFISNSVLMPIAACLTCFVVAFITKPKMFIDEVELSGKFRQKKMFVAIIKYISPIFLLIILVSSVLNAFGIMKI